MSLEWKYEKLGKLCSFDKESINPIKDIEYYHYSFPAFDNNKEPEVEMGQDIKSSKFLFNKGDILFNKLNVKFKRVWDIDFDINENSICSTEFIPIQAKHIDRNFLYYCLISPNFTNEMKYLSTGTSNSHQRINPKDIKDYDLFLPIDKEIQRKIGHILKLLDKKISINTEINKNLLQLSKVIFKNWFVEFEPFGGVQPNNWKICTLEDVCDLKAGGDKPDVVSDEITDTCSYPIYSNGLDKDGLYGYTDQAKIFEESVTVSARGTIGFVCLRHIPYLPIVRLVSVIPKKEFISAKYLYLFLDRLNIMGTGTTQQQLTIPDFKKTEILVPTLDIIKSFTNYITPIFKKIWIQEEEIKKLQKLRDTLLPKLMSGEIDVSKINCDMLMKKWKLILNNFTSPNNLIKVIV